MKVVIAGSRTSEGAPKFIENQKAINTLINEAGFEISEIVSGHARGIDKAGEEYAKQNNIPIKLFIPKWNRADGSLNRAAGFDRNKLMIEYAEALIAIWDGKGRGTRHTIDYAKKRYKKGNIAVFIIDSNTFQEEN